MLRERGIFFTEKNEEKLQNYLKNNAERKNIWKI
jgi:hypothetical protein